MRWVKAALLGTAMTVSLGQGARADVPQVAADILPVHSLVARVMQGLGEPALIVRKGASPHGYAMRPSEAQALQDADLVVWTGELLTPWLEKPIENLAGDATKLELMGVEGTVLLPFRDYAILFKDDAAHKDHDHEAHDHKEEGHDDHEDHDHDDHEDHDHDKHDHAKHDDDDHKDHDDDDHKGHDHEDHAKEDHDDHDHDDHGHSHAPGAMDPHVWLSPENAALWMNEIAARLSELDPDNAAAYQENARAGQAELKAALSEIEALLAPVREMPFVSFHDAYQYFAAYFDLNQVGAVRLGDAGGASPAALREVQERLLERRVVCAFGEPQFDDALLRTVLPKEGVKLGMLDPVGSDIAEGADFYPQLLKELANGFATCAQ